MDSKMVDTEENREDRKIMQKEVQGLTIPTLPSSPESEMVRNASLPNRKKRRAQAKRLGVFKHKGAWLYVSKRSRQHL